MLRVLVCFFVFSTINNAFAGVVIGGTRLIYDGGKKESSISVTNPDKNSPYLIQSWVDSAGPNDDVESNSKAPFLTTPPLFRLDAESENTIRVIKTNEANALPADRESVFWLDVKSIPSVPKTTNGEKQQNTLQFAVKTRIKLFYRPDGIEFSKGKDPQELVFESKGNQVTINNPTPFYFTLYSLSIGGNKINLGNNMVPPKGVQSFDIGHPVGSGNVTWKYINDYGGLSEEITSVVK